MQNIDNQLALCHVCGAMSGSPCVTREGVTALQVHRGRAGRSQKLREAQRAQRAAEDQRGPQHPHPHP